MDTKQFLKLVTPDGIRCIAMQAEKGFVQWPAHELDEAVALAEWIDSKQKNAFFALATFKETYTNDNNKTRVKRKRKNADSLKSLWVDLDFKDCPDPTMAGALLEVRNFLAKTDWPKPTAIVSSGNGMHLYWPLSSPVPYESWLPLAQAFKNMCIASGLPADHACTADASRVLRPVGTHNWKDADNPKAVVWVGGSGHCFDFADLSTRAGSVGSVRDGSRTRDSEGDRQVSLPEHLKRAVGGDTKEFTTGAGRSQNSKVVFKKCAALRHILVTKGAEQDEPEWSATLTLLAHLDDGGKYVHPMSSGHPDYDADTVMEKWQQKVEAVEDGTGPTLCSTFESWHEDKCAACPFHKARKVKTPKSLAYMDDTPPPTKEGRVVPSLQSVVKFQKGQLPAKYRVGGNNDCIEKKTWNEVDKQYEWVPVLRQVWEIEKASREIQSKLHEVSVKNTCGQDVSKFVIPSWQFGAADLTKTIAGYGCPIVGANELKEFKLFMTTWLDELRHTNQIEDVTGQLGWIVDSDQEEHPVIGFACGTTAFYLNGDVREGVVSASGKFKGIEASFKPSGLVEPWAEAAAAIVDQGCDHLIMMLSTAFAAPLMRFSGQPGAVVSLVSEDSAAGKSTGLKLAQAVWGNPSHAPATMDDTHTVVKNKLAYLQNLPAYWDEVRGDDHKMQTFIQVCFQVAQGRDRERANSKAETIRAEEWQTLLAACSNESLFDLAAEKAAESNAGIYRIFEVKVGPGEYPAHDAEIIELVNQTAGNYGHAGLAYAEFLTTNYDRIRDEMKTMRLALERKVNLKGPERFWVAAITAMVLGAKYAGEAGLVQIDSKRLLTYLLNSLHKLRARAVLGKQRLSPRELVAAYAQQHQDGRVTVDRFPTGAGRPVDPILQGNHGHVRKPMFVEAKDNNMMMVLKSDFKTWLIKSKLLKFNDKLMGQFTEDVLMIERKQHLASGTKFKLPRAQVLIFDLNEREESK